MKFITEYGPIIVFFIAYKLYGIFYATGLMMIATIISLTISYYYERKISKITLVSACILFLSSIVTLITGDSSYIKVKPTIVYTIFGSILYIGLIYKKIFLKSIIGHAIRLQDEKWVILSRRFAFFFFFMAIMNEIIWRNFSENFWVNYKLFGTLALMFLFFFSQILFLHKNSLK